MRIQAYYPTLAYFAGHVYCIHSCSESNNILFGKLFFALSSPPVNPSPQFKGTRRTEMIETFENDRSNRTQLILNPQPLKRGKIWEKLTAVLRIGVGKLNYGKAGKK